MDVELKTGGMVWMPVGYDTDTKREVQVTLIEANQLSAPNDSPMREK